MCLYPRIIKNPKYKKNKKNGGVMTPPSDHRVLYVPIGCGKCMECMKKKARDWQIRIAEECRNRNDAKFITLTFSNEAIERIEKVLEYEEERDGNKDNAIVKKAIRLFLERWRKKYKKSVKHWFTTELGEENDRIHLHGIIWTDKTREEINERWGYGRTWTGEYVNEITINYITKYMSKIDEKHKEYKPIILTSAGIGVGYTNRIDAKNNKYNEDGTNEAYKFRNGKKAMMPIYYRNKIYSEKEREKLWIEKIEKKEKWIGGEKLLIKNNDKSKKEQIEAMEYYRKKSKRLGYGEPKIKNDETNYWERLNEINKGV